MYIQLHVYSSYSIHQLNHRDRKTLYFYIEKHLFLNINNSQKIICTALYI